MTPEQNRANEYLSQIRNADKELTEIFLKIEFLRYKASGSGSIRYDKEHVQTSPEDKLCDAVTEAVTLEKKLLAHHRKIQRMRTRTQEIIGLWNDNNAKFIDVYYLSRGSMTKAAELIGCSSRNVYFIKLRALTEFSKYL